MSSPINLEPDLDGQILRAAKRLIDTGEKSAFTMDRLATTSGISRATIYRRFKYRTSLLKRLASEHGVQVDELDLDTDIRNRILQATRAVINANGTIDFTVEQVAAGAGVGVATVYRHFGSKENLLQRMAEQFHPRRAAQDLLLHTSDDIAADLRQFAQNVLQFMQSQSNFARLLISGDTRVKQLFGSIRTDQERTLSALTRYLEAQIEAGRLQARDPFDLSTAFMGMLMGFAFVKPTYTEEKNDPEQVARFIVQLFLSGIMKDD
jgi:TetR/AcrR family transcriptional repressor of mexJK operon